MESLPAAEFLNYHHLLGSSEITFCAMPSAVASEAIERYGFVSIGRSKDVVTRFYAITAERRFTHPAILALTAPLGSAKRRSISRS